MNLKQVKQLRVDDRVWDTFTEPYDGIVIVADGSKIRVLWGKGTTEECRSTYSFNYNNLSAIIHHWESDPYDLWDIE